MCGGLCFPQEEILCDTEDSRKELILLQAKYDQAVEQRTLIQLEKEDVAVVILHILVCFSESLQLWTCELAPIWFYHSIYHSIYH